MARKLVRRATTPEPEPEPEPEVPEEIDILELEEPEAPTDWNPTPLLYDVTDTCLMLGKISRQMLYRLINLDQLHAIKVGTRSMFTLEELERFVSDRARETEEAAALLQDSDDVALAGDEVNGGA